MKSAIAALLVLFATPALVAAAPAKVLVLPFESAGPAEKQWIAKAVQHNLMAELSRVNSVAPIAGKDAASTTELAAKAAADAGADFVIFGSYQAVDADLRFTGQVVDVTKKQAIAGLKSTGSQRDLFGMEDILANQVKRALPQPVAEEKPEMLRQPAPPPPVIEANGPVKMAIDQRAKELEDQIDRAINRLRYANPDPGGDYYYPPYYFYSGIYTPYYYYPYYSGCHHHHHWHDTGSNLSINGAFRGNNVAGTFSIGGGASSGRNFVVPQTTNYANHGSLSIQPTAARR